MKNTSIILFVVLLSLTVCGENVKADSVLSGQKEQGQTIVEGIFKLADDIFALPVEVLGLGNKDVGGKVEGTLVEKKILQSRKRSADKAFTLNNTLNDITKSLGWAVEGIGKGLDESFVGLGDFLEGTGEFVWEVVEGSADLAFVAGVTYLFIMADGFYFDGSYYHHGCGH